MEYGLSGLSMAMRILSRNQEVFGHSFNTAKICKDAILYLPEGYLTMPANNICLAALYHDIGKSNWQKDWFCKAKLDLTNEDINQMKNHAVEGANLLKKLVPAIPKDIIKLIREHHERPGGVGYPRQLKEVSREVLVVAACDVYSACTEARGYRNGIFTKKEALDIVAEFAPAEIVEALLRVGEECNENKKGVNF